MGGVRALALLAVGASALVALVESCAVDPYLTCGDACDDAGFQGDATTGDASSPDDGAIPTPCATLDASCLGAPVPAGWIAIAIQRGAPAACPGAPGDFFSKVYATSPTLDQGSCACTGCAPSGSWTCTATLVSTLGCVGTGANFAPGECDQSTNNSVMGSVARSGTVTCPAAKQIGTLDASSTPLGACVPESCNADFCALAAQGFELCVMSADVTDGACPADFPHATLAGDHAVASCGACQTCALANATASCGSTVVPYGDSRCQAGERPPLILDGGCQAAGSGVSSVLYPADAAPTPNCGPKIGTTTGTATLASPATICCAN